jgi:hypothetical protein
MITAALEQGMTDKFAEELPVVVQDLAEFAAQMQRKGVDMRVTFDTHEQQVIVIARVAPNAPSTNPIIVCFDGRKRAFDDVRKIKLRIETELKTWGKANVSKR